MKLKNKAILAAALSVILLLCAFTASAEMTPSLEKEEVIYASLSADGAASGVYVVNSFELDDKETITDYGTYSSLSNLTNSNAISYSSGTVSVEGEKGMFWYQGNMDDVQLPWLITVTYFLNGTEVTAQQAAGAEGDMEIIIKTAENPHASGTFFDDYTLQISASLDTALCAHISAPDGTVASSGNDKVVSFVSMAGSENEFSITAHVEDFQMDAITVAGVKMDMSAYLDSFDLSSLTDGFSDELSQLTDGIAQLDDGAGELLGGTETYADGADRFAGGLAQFSDGVSDFSDGVGELAEGVNQLNSGVNQLTTGSESLSDAAGQLSGGLNTLSENGAALNTGAQTIADSTFAAVNAQMANFTAGSEITITLTEDNYAGTLSSFKTLMPDMSGQIDLLIAQLDGVVQFKNGVSAYTAGVSQTASGAKALADGLDQYSQGVAQLADASAQLARGSDQLAAGAAELTDGAAELSDGAAALASGSHQLASGVSDYKDGTALFRAGTDNMDETIDDYASEISGQLLPEAGKTCSFTSEKNTAVKSVQFVMRIDAVGGGEVAAQPEPEPKLNLLQKLLRLFGLY